MLLDCRRIAGRGFAVASGRATIKGKLAARRVFYAIVLYHDSQSVTCISWLQQGLVARLVAERWC